MSSCPPSPDEKQAERLASRHIVACDISECDAATHCGRQYHRLPTEVAVLPECESLRQDVARDGSSPCRRFHLKSEMTQVDSATFSATHRYPSRHIPWSKGW